MLPLRHDYGGNDPMEDYVQLGWSWQNEGQLPLLIGIAVLLGLGKGGVPGFATIATAATVATAPSFIQGGLGFAVALQNPILLMIDISAAWLHWKDLDLGSIMILVPFSFLGLGLGQFLDNRLSDSQSRLLVGVFLLVILGIQMLPKDSVGGGSTTTKQRQTTDSPASKDEDELLLDAESGSSTFRGGSSDTTGDLRRRSPATKENATSKHNSDISESGNRTIKNAPEKVPSLSAQQKLGWAATVGVVGGAATMLTNAMGPILNIYLLSVVKLSPTAYIGTRAVFFCVLNVGKLPMRFLAGTLGWKMIPLAGFLGAVSVVGVVCAKPIMLSMSKASFVKLELAVVAFSGLRLCWMGYYGS